jgi:membrane associated rhomboid family serine protease
MRPPESWRNARVTLAIALGTALVSLAILALGLRDWAAVWGGFIPLRASVADNGGLAPFLLTPLTAALIHAGYIHLGFNMLIHLFCGRAVEGVLGPWGIVTLYIGGAYAAAAAQYFAGPTDMTPMIGASGAISAVLGAYALLFGRNRVKLANPIAALWLNALWLIAAWIGLQLILGFTFATAGVQIAIAAHIGGFVLGLALANPLLLARYRGA